MATKTLTIMEDAYEMLKAAKKENESFSDVIRREFSSKKNDLKRFWGSIDNETANIVRETIKKSRELSRKRMKNYDMS
jgi:predicted CopG family antitoxin